MPNNTQAMTEFVQSIARMTMDGECPWCLKDGFGINPDCPGAKDRLMPHYPWEMPIDDAFETLGSLIAKARGLIKE